MENIKEIILITSPYRGYVEGSGHGKGGLEHSGLGKIKVVMIDGVIHTFKYLMKTEKQRDNLSSVLRSWYLQGVSVKEYSLVTQDKLLLLRKDWSYKEFQKLKEELNITSIYS